MRPEDQIGAHHAGDRSRRADDRDGRPGPEGHLDDHGRHAGDDVEGGETERPEPVLDVVPEHPEEQHVEPEVREAPVEEHRGQDREVDVLLGEDLGRGDRRGGDRGVVRAGLRLRLSDRERFALRDLARDRGVLVEEEVLVADLGEGGPAARLDEEEDDDVDDDQQERDDRTADRRVEIPDGDDHRLSTLPAERRSSLACGRAALACAVSSAKEERWRRSRTGSGFSMPACSSPT